MSQTQICNDKMCPRDKWCSDCTQQFTLTGRSWKKRICHGESWTMLYILIQVCGGHDNMLVREGVNMQGMCFPMSQDLHRLGSVCTTWSSLAYSFPVSKNIYIYCFKYPVICTGLGSYTSFRFQWKIPLCCFLCMFLGLSHPPMSKQSTIL